MDEAYIKVGGRWVYLYRAVDKAGGTVDFFLSENRDVNAAKISLRRAMRKTRKPAKITLDAYAASHCAVREMKETGELSNRVMVRSSQYLNNRPPGGQTADAQVQVIRQRGCRHQRNRGGEKIKKGQFETSEVGGCRATMSELSSSAPPLEPIANTLRLAELLRINQRVATLPSCARKHSHQQLM
jgi:hypothetical protein